MPQPSDPPNPDFPIAPYGDSAAHLHAYRLKMKGNQLERYQYKQYDEYKAKEDDSAWHRMFYFATAIIDATNYEYAGLAVSDLYGLSSVTVRTQTTGHSDTSSVSTLSPSISSFTLSAASPTQIKVTCSESANSDYHIIAIPKYVSTAGASSPYWSNYLAQGADEEWSPSSGAQTVSITRPDSSGSNPYIVFFVECTTAVFDKPSATPVVISATKAITLPAS